MRPMTAADDRPRAAVPGWRHRFGRAVPYLLLAPGLLWLLVFYVLPAVQMFTYSHLDRDLENGFEFTGSPDAYVEAIDRVRASSS